MTGLRTRLAVAGACTVALGSAVAPALAIPHAPKRITSAGVGAVKLGASYQALRSARLVGPLRPGCELAGPNARSARLRAPLTGSVELTLTSPRKVASITVLAGATARGVGIGASSARVERAFPKAVFDHTSDEMFGVTIVTVPKSGGGRLQLAVDAGAGKVTSIAVPGIPFCE